MEQHVHIGRNISKIRELLGVKQGTLAENLKVSQQTVSKIEQTNQLNQHVIDRIALALGVPSTIIAQYDENNLLDCLKGRCNPNKVPSKYLELLEKITILFEQILQLEQGELNDKSL